MWTFEILLFRVSKSTNLVLNINLPPLEMINSLRFLIIFIKLSVPMWGFVKYKICSGAPKFTNSCRTFLQYGELIPLVSFPSEKVPAPPSPNCTFEYVFNFPVLIKVSTVFFLSSTVWPCSIIIGL